MALFRGSRANFSGIQNIQRIQGRLQTVVKTENRSQRLSIASRQPHRCHLASTTNERMQRMWAIGHAWRASQESNLDGSHR